MNSNYKVEDEENEKDVEMKNDENEKGIEMVDEKNEKNEKKIEIENENCFDGIETKIILDEKIKITLIHNKAHIFSATDVFTLKKRLRICGTLVGTLPCTPRQTQQNGLPLFLLPEEVALLLEYGWADLVQYPEMSKPVRKEIKESINQLTLRSYEDQCLISKEQKMKEIRGRLHEIVAGKKRKLLNNSSISVDISSITEESVLEEECNKFKKLPQNSQLIETYKEFPFINSSKNISPSWNYPSTEEEKIKYNVFKDLWGKNYFITSGTKFGTDFLAYEGDPLIYHAALSVQVVGDEKEIDSSTLILWTRLSTAVKKTFVLASCDKEGNVHYTSWKWMGK